MNKQMKNACKMIESSFLKVSISKKRNPKHLVFENVKNNTKANFNAFSFYRSSLMTF